ncbi:MAG TPA: prephenate dehydrogenase/arogenate dehydrogenase family protein, partial [Myxococcales bacterium]|nr:prephenate dehydrogenase/arogenate dehydrogenase family protein [Myxococcales bacterium]
MPVQERIAIVGLGLIGGSLALALRRARPDLAVTGIDVDPRTREQALAEKAVSAASTLEAAPLGEFDTVVLCTPAQQLLEMLPGVAARMRPGALLTDVCGAKERVCAQGAAQDRVVFIGGHPMAGTEFRGFVAANPTLFIGCTVALCPPVGARDPAARKEAARRAGELWMLAGAQQILDVQPDAHDRAVTIA